MSIRGFNNQKAHGQANHVTVQGAGSDKHAIPTAQLYLTDLTAALTISSAVLSGDEKEITITLSGAHNSRIGDVIRILSGTLSGWEYEIKEISSATAVKVWSTSSVAPIAGVSIKACRWVTAKADSEGALTTASGPIQFTRNGSTQTVVEDTTVPANNRPLPVKITGITGDINITANDLNVSLDHANDSIKIGDGVDLLAINADGSINVSGPLTDAQIRATALPVSGPLTDAQIRATALPVSGPLTDAQIRATALPVSGPLTDAQLRAVAVPVSGTFFQATQPVSAATLPLPTGAATSAKQDLLLAELQLKADLTETQPVSLASIPLPTGAATQATLASLLTELQLKADLTETQPVSMASAAPEAVRAASFQEILNLTTVAQTFTAPANAKWCKIMNTTVTAAETIRVKIGGVATTTSGMRLEPGRSEDFDVAGNISVIAEAGTNQCISVIFGV